MYFHYPLNGGFEERKKKKMNYSNQPSFKLTVHSFSFEGFSLAKFDESLPYFLTNLFELF